MINKKRLIKLTQQLIGLNSENPPGDESRIARFVGQYLDRLGLKTTMPAFKKNRQNVIGVLKGKNSKHSLLLTPHLDTVPRGRNWHFDPFGGSISRGRLYGLGATDCKGNLAAAMEAIRSIVEEKTTLGYNLVFAATADEESGSGLGLVPLLKKGILKADAAVVLDADDFHIIVSQKGLLHLKVKIRGRRAHGAYPWLGQNAIDIAVKSLSDIKNRKSRYIKDRYLRQPTVNIGTISGGDKVNVVADWCEFELDFRFLPGQSGQKIISWVKKIIKRHTRNFDIEVEGFQREYRIEEGHTLVRQLCSAMKKMRIRPLIKGSEGATVITFFQEKKIPAVACGFGNGGCAHSPDEYIGINDLYRGSCVVEEFLKNYKFNQERKQ